MGVNAKFNIQSRETKKRGIVYDVYFYDCGKQKKLSGFKTKTEAKRAYLDYVSSPHEDVESASSSVSVLKYEKARSLYLDSASSLVKESSLYDFRHTASLYHDVFFKNKNLMQMTKADLLAFQDWLRSRKKPNGEPYSIRTLLKVYGQFAAFYRWCVLRLDCPDVMQGVSFSVRKAQKRTYTVWTQDDFTRFIEAVSAPKYKALFTVLFYGGMRVGELQAAKVADFDGSALFIHSTLTKKTLDGSSFKITETKNYKARRVPLPAPCLAVLRPWAENRPGDEFLFGGASPVALNPIRYAFDKAISLSGVPRIRIHDLRHSYVSLLISKGANFAVVASLIGDTLDQVIKTYAHSIEEDKKTVISQIW